MEKLIIKKVKPQLPGRTSVLMRVLQDDYLKIKDVSIATGFPMTQVITLLVDFAIENLEIKED